MVWTASGGGGGGGLILERGTRLGGCVYGRRDVGGMRKLASVFGADVARGVAVPQNAIKKRRPRGRGRVHALQQDGFVRMERGEKNGG